MRHQVLHLSLAIATLLACNPNDPGQTAASGGTRAPSEGGSASAPGDKDQNPPRSGGASGKSNGTASSDTSNSGGSAQGGVANKSGGSSSIGKSTRASGGDSQIDSSETTGGASDTAATSNQSHGGAPSTGTRTAGGNTAASNGGGVGSTSSATSRVSPGSCSRAVGACTAPVVRVVEVDLGIPVTGYGREGDTDPFPMTIAAIPAGGSRLAWLGADQKIYIAELDCEDHLVGTPFSVPAVDLQDVIADESGGVVLLTRDATNGGTDNCGTGKLCGGTSSPCRTMWMVRFDNSGNVEWETQVTNLSDALAGYQNGARFIWWYQHHGRLAFDGSNYAAFFGVAITVNNGSCVDIHEGDRMQVVGPTGALLSGHNSFEVGMSHAWTSRIVWDPRSSKFAMTDATDNNCRIAIPGTATTIASGTCDGTLFNGDLVLATSGGYWDAWSQGGSIKLEHFTTGKSDKTVIAGKAAHPHLVSYGEGNMLLAWASSAGMSAQVRDAGDAADPLGSEFTIAVSDHDYGAFKAYTDGSVAYAASGATNKSVKIARVMPCE